MELKTMRAFGLGFLIIICVLFTYNYICDNNNEKVYILRDTCGVDSVKSVIVDTLLTDSTKKDTL